MNPISKALEEIRWTLPDEILKQAFINPEILNTGRLVNLETLIRETVLERRVFVDMDIMGGTETYIALDSPVKSEYVDPYTVVYTIPDDVTQNRPIVQAYSIHFGILGYQNAGMALSYTESPLGSEVRKVLDSAIRTPPAVTSYLNVIAHNVIMVRFVYLPYTAAFLRCRLGNDEALSFIRSQSIPLFSKLCILAVKAYIYNKMLLPMGQGVLSGGQELGVFREKVMEWADAEEQYQEMLKKWMKVSRCFNDPESRRRHLRTIMPSL